MPREEFVRLVTTDLPEAPAYFSRDAALNREGPQPLADLPPAAGLSPAEVEKALARGRRPSRHARHGRVRRRARPGLAAHRSLGAVRVLGRHAAFAAGTRRPRGARTRSGSPRRARAWRAWASKSSPASSRAASRPGRPPAGRSPAPSRSTSTSSASACARTRSSSSSTCAVRPSGTGVTSRGARAMPLHQLAELAPTLDRTRPVAAICAGGYRSSIATSVLERSGFPRVINVVGGMARLDRREVRDGNPEPRKRRQSAGGGMRKLVMAVAVLAVAGAGARRGKRRVAATGTPRSPPGSA